MHSRLCSRCRTACRTACRESNAVHYDPLSDTLTKPRTMHYSSVGFVLVKHCLMVSTACLLWLRFGRLFGLQHTSLTRFAKLAPCIDCTYLLFVARCSSRGCSWSAFRLSDFSAGPSIYHALSNYVDYGRSAPGYDGFCEGVKHCGSHQAPPSAEGEYGNS